jgi:hypothetical protein
MSITTPITKPITKGVTSPIVENLGEVFNPEGSLLLESGDKLLLEDGVSDLLLEG